MKTTAGSVASTDAFRTTIEAHLDDKALHDAAFMEQYSDKTKNLSSCLIYIMNQVKRSGLNGFTDEEVYSMAVQYYTTKDIDVGTEIKADVVVNHTVVLTDKEKAEARTKAMDELTREIKAKARKKPTAKKKAVSQSKTSVEKAGEAQAKAKKVTPPTNTVQPTLF